MQGLKVRVSVKAANDIADIADYIEVEFGQKRADRFLSEIRKQIQNLQIFSRQYGDTGIVYRGHMICKKVFAPSVILFYIEDETVFVMRVLREERLWQKIIKEDIDYEFI